MTQQTNTPGSDEAARNGCTCPRMGNANGEGIPVGGERMFWYNGACPLHGGTDD